MSWRLTVRAGGRVQQVRFDGLDELLDALEQRGRELAGSARGKEVNLRVKRFDPEQQVVGRLELAGPERFIPSVRAGIDIHGDGSTQAFRGGLRRVPLDQGPDGDGFRSLRRALAEVLEAAGPAEG